MNIVTIIILAMIAIFVGLRLYSVLGNRGGHEQKPLQRPAHPTEKSSATSPPLHIPDSLGTMNGATQGQQGDVFVYDVAIEEDIKKLMFVDRSFNTGYFMDGAQQAYRMILEAFWSGEQEKLRDLTEDGLYAGFVEAITEREEREEKLDNRLVRIENMQIVGAQITEGIARVTVRFVADIVAITRDSKGEVIAGSLDDAIGTCDQWTFMRAIYSEDPNWRLEQTETITESDSDENANDKLNHSVVASDESSPTHKAD